MPVFETPALTPEEIAAKAVLQAKMRINGQVMQYVRAYMKEFDSFWRNPQCTPEQMATAWGTECLAMFTKSAATKAYLLSLDANCLDHPELDYINAPLPVNPEIVDGAPTGRMIVG